MGDCKNIAIRFKEEEGLYKQFIQAKVDYDMQRRERGERETSCIEFSKILIHKALKEGEESEEAEGGEGKKK
ncbi:MAG: hypothetical protein H8D26_00915 [Methanomicrobia archaeon]|nr:hypothetical protein [Methanomicrobia archaeon]